MKKSQGKRFQKYDRILKPYFEVYLCHPFCWRSLRPLLAAGFSSPGWGHLAARASRFTQDQETVERQPSTNCLHAFQMDEFSQLFSVSASEILLLAHCRSAQQREWATLAMHGDGCDFGSTASSQVPKPAA